MMDRGIVRNTYSFISKIKFEKLVNLVGFIIRKFVTMHIHMNVQFVTMHGHMNVQFVTMHGHMNLQFVTMHGHMNVQFVTMHGHMNVQFVTMHGHMNVQFVTMHGHMNVKYGDDLCVCSITNTIKHNSKVVPVWGAEVWGRG
jgi:hypothetical protein